MMLVADKQVPGADRHRRRAGAGGGVAGIGSGGNYALAAARALIDGPLDAEQIVRKSMEIAADICVYTNRTSPRIPESRK